MSAKMLVAKKCFSWWELHKKLWKLKLFVPGNYLLCKCSHVLSTCSFLIRVYFLVQHIKPRKPPAVRVLGPNRNTLALPPAQSPQTLTTSGCDDENFENLPFKDHTAYCIQDQYTLKRKFDLSCSALQTAKKKLKTVQKKCQRQRKQVNSLKEIVDRLQNNNMISEFCTEALQSACSSAVPPQLIKRLLEKNARILRNTIQHLRHLH